MINIYIFQISASLSKFVQNMKSVKIRKNHELSSSSKIYIHVGERKIHIKGFGEHSVSINPGEEFRVTHLWTGSKILKYDDLSDVSTFLVKPRIGKLFGLVLLVVFSICTCIFLFTRFRWSFIPLVPFAIYIFIYMSILKDRYLIIKPIKEESE